MAPIFGESSRPRLKPTGARSGSNNGAQKPVFKFDVTRSTSQSNGFFRVPTLSIPQEKQHHQQISLMEESWDMGDDGSDGVNIGSDNSGALTLEDDSIATVADIMDQYKPELTAFARRLDESKLVVRSKSSKTAKNSRPGLKLIDEFRSYAAEQVEAATRTLSDLENMSPESRGDRYETNFRMARHEVRYWTLEHQTWELFEGLVTHRFETFPNDRAPGEFTDNKYISDICIRDYLYQHHSIFKELIIVLEWLQRHSLAPSIDEIEEEGLYRGDRGWMYTKERIKADKRLNTGKQLLHFGRMSNGFKAGTARYIVTELDPDAPSRQQRQLEQEDEGWERYLMRLVWAFLRKGQVKDAQDLCDDAGEYWRSATLGGSEIAWDPQIDGVREDGEERRVMGNRRRELWKRMCFAIARRKGGDEFEKAVYGTLCGDVESVIPVCETWEDHLFAHINSLVEGFYASYLDKASRIPPTVTKFPSFDPVAYHTRGTTLEDDETILPRIVDSVASLDYLKESRLPLRTVQGAFISSRIHELVLELDRQLKLYHENPEYDIETDELACGLDVSDYRLLRVVVHILFVLQSLDAGFTEETEHHAAAENVIAGYVQLLGTVEKFELIPLYASRLSLEKAIEVVGKSLLVFGGDRNKRLDLIQKMHMHGIDVNGCLKKAMDLSLEHTILHYDAENAVSGHGLLSKGFTGEIQPEDAELIHGLEWMLLGDDSLRPDLVRKGCEVYKRFLVTGRLSAAKELWEKIHSKNIVPSTLLNSFDMMDEGVYELTSIFEDDESQLAATIFLELECILGCVIALEAWRDAVKNRPERMERTFKHKLQPIYERIVHTVPEAIQSLLNAPSLLEVPSIRIIRNIYLPELVLALHRVHVEAGLYINRQLLIQTLELSTIVADPTRTILDTFTETGRLAEYVDEIAGASRNILGGAQDGVKGMSIWSVAT